MECWGDKERRDVEVVVVAAVVWVRVMAMVWIGVGVMVLLIYSGGGVSATGELKNSKVLSNLCHLKYSTRITEAKIAALQTTLLITGDFHVGQNMNHSPWVTKILYLATSFPDLFVD